MVTTPHITPVTRSDCVSMRSLLCAGTFVVPLRAWLGGTASTRTRPRQRFLFLKKLTLTTHLRNPVHARGDTSFSAKISTRTFTSGSTRSIRIRGGSMPKSRTSKVDSPASRIMWSSTTVSVM